MRQKTITASPARMNAQTVRRMASMSSGDGKSDMWQPIETAPKDGQKAICGCWKDGDWLYAEIMQWDAGYDGSNEGSAWCWNDDIDAPFDQPTHWMPLPKPPDHAK